MRKFTLINKDGTTYDITSKGSAFFYKVDGLGYERNMTFSQVSDNFPLITDKASQQTIKGTLRFWQPNAEKQYFDFCKFLKNAPLRMKYNPGHGDYYRNGYIKAVGRTDGKNGALTAEISFICTSPWYKTVQVYNDGEITDGKIYDYEYDYTYTEATPGSIIIDSDSMIDSPCKLIIYGAVTNPVWSHYVNGVLVATGKLNATVNVNRKVVIDTTTEPWSIKQFDNLGNLVSDMYQLSDFSTERFIQIKNGRNIISVTDDGADDVTLSVEAQIGYDTV